MSFITSFKDFDTIKLLNYRMFIFEETY